MLARSLAPVALLLAAAAPATAATAGGASATPTPRVAQVLCRTDCAGVATARPGSVVRLRGRALDQVERIVFQGARGGADDTDAVPRIARARFLDVVVPLTAVSGRLVAVNADGAQSRATSRIALIVEPGAAAPAELRSTGSEVTSVDTELQTHKVFYGAERKATLVYLLRGSAPAVVHVELVRADGVVVARWTQGPVAPDTPQSVVWDGTTGGVVEEQGRYEFRVFAETSDGVRVQSSAAEPGRDAATGFLFLRHRFPVRGPHDYGGGVAAFGGARHHQGQDVFARCGTPLVAARAGVVKLRQTHSRAGNYVVIDGDGTGVDYVYMHLREPAPVRKGDRVSTGQVIGAVGDTGDADGCHLHFELWDEPGWSTGGRPFDPLSHLRGWDAFS